MRDSVPDQTPYDPEAIILVSRSLPRRDAIKALLGIIFFNIPLIVVASYNAAKAYLSAGGHSRAVLVIDGWSMDDVCMYEIHSLKQEFPEILYLLLVENPKDRTVICDPALDEVLAGNVSSNKFIDVLRTMVAPEGS